MTAEQYAAMMKLLLPPGRLWRLDPDSLLSKALLAAGDELVRVGARGDELIEESNPLTTDELLPEWERALDLEATGTVDERRVRVVARLIARQRVRPIDLKNALAPLLGQTTEDVVIIERTAAQALTMGDQREIYRFFIYRDPTEPGSYDLDAAQALVDQMAHSHTKGHVIESVSFLCDDPYSLCDRDILGV